jgi:hypothetical protein
MAAALFVLGLMPLQSAPGMGTRPPPGGRFEYDLTKYEDAGGSTGWKREEKMQPPIKGAGGIAVTRAGNIIVAGERRAVVYDADLQTIGAWELKSSANCLYAVNTGLVYTCAGDHVEVYENGRLRDAWQQHGTEAVLTSIAVVDGTVFVADAGNASVLQYEPDGTFKGSLAGGESKTFVAPGPYMDVAAGREGTVWVADTGRLELKNFDRDGGFLSSWGKSSHKLDGFCGCCNPVHFAILPDGAFVTAEKGFVRVKVHKPNGALDSLVFGPGFLGKGINVEDVAADRKGRIYVLDSKGMLHIFGRKDAP